MARIRSIKPDFPQSESMGRVSREARFLFILLWTVCDDAGRTRGNSRILASLLYPYDDDAPKHIDKWLGELEREKCVVRYTVDGNTYLEIINWLKHQKIDKPTASKIPPFSTESEVLANPREPSRVSSLGLEGKGKEGSGSRTFVPPTLQQVIDYCKERNKNVDANKWFNHYSANGWKVGKNPMKDWQAAVRTWEKDVVQPPLTATQPSIETYDREATRRRLAAAMGDTSANA